MSRAAVVVLCAWLLVAVLLSRDPLMILLGGPVAGLALLIFLATMHEPLATALKRREAVVFPAADRRLVVALLVGLCACSVAGAIASATPSMAVRQASGAVTNHYALSVLVAPILWAAVLVTAVRAILLSSPRRIAIAALVTACAWPFLVAIRGLREPFFDIDDEFVLTAPAIVGSYVVATLLASAAALVLAFVVGRLATAPLIPPRATARG